MGRKRGVEQAPDSFSPSVGGSTAAITGGSPTELAAYFTTVFNFLLIVDLLGFINCSFITYTIHSEPS